MLHRNATIHPQHLTGDIGRGGQKRHCLSHFLGLAIRPSGMAARSPLSWPDRSRVISVSIKPGATALQVIPLGASSLATALVRPMSPALAAE